MSREKESRMQDQGERGQGARQEQSDSSKRTEREQRLSMEREN